VARHALNALQAHADLQKKVTSAKAASPTAYADIQTQMQGLTASRYSSTLNCFVTIFKEEGSFRYFSI
jgi:nitrate reductase cytochrome c-type subunit